MSWFRWNDIDSDSMGVVVEALPPIARAPRRYDKVEIDGMDGAYVDELGYAVYEKVISVGFQKMADFNSIFDWLAGQGKLVTSDEPDKYYICNIYDVIEFTKSGNIYKADIKMIAQPFKYDINEGEVECSSGDEVNIGCGTRGALYSFSFVSTGGNINVAGNGADGERKVFTLSTEETGTEITIDAVNNKIYTNTGSSLLNKANGELPDFKKYQTEKLSVDGSFTNGIVRFRRRWL